MLDWKRYLQSICATYAEWWKAYTLTDVVGKKHNRQVRKSLLLDLQAIALKPEAVKPEKEQLPEVREKREILNVLEGLRKYASEHVLLIGRPGSGKSTALARLLLEEAQFLIDEGEAETSKIPILVELRYYQTSIIDLIKDFLHRHDPSLAIDGEAVKILLRQGQFLLLIDGVNELPSSQARRDLQKFRQDFQKTTPMIFTTRDLGVGGDLEISKKLEMQPLTETQMRDFVRGYLPEVGEQMLKQLGDRLRKFGETPLLLMMLCSVFASNQNKLPPNLGSVFRSFTEIYDHQLKQDVPISQESRRWWKRLLQHLAWVMMGGNPHCRDGKFRVSTSTEFLVAIPRQQAEEIFTEFLEGKVNCAADCAIAWLDDLLKHHLIQLGAENKIEFRHQLIQEYYAAERFLQEVGKLSNDELQWDYLNYLKWTEPVVLMMELVEDEALALRVVKLALQVDWQLGARLAGAVKPQWQEKTIRLICDLGLPQLLQIKLLGITKSNAAISNLIGTLQNQNSKLCEFAVKAIGEIGSESANLVLIKALKHPIPNVRYQAVFTLGKSNYDTVIYDLMTALNDEDYSVRFSAVYILGKIGNYTAVNGLIKTLKHQDYAMRINAVELLYKIGSETIINTLKKYLACGDRIVRFHAAKALSKSGDENAIKYLERILIFELKYGDEDIRQNAAIDLGEMGYEIVIPDLMKILDNECDDSRWKAVIALSNIKSDAAINTLMLALKDESREIRVKAAETLEKIKLDITGSELIQLLNNKDWRIRWRAVNSLSISDNDEAINRLIIALKDKDFTVRWKAAEALGKIGSQKAVSSLTKLLTDEYIDVRWKAAEALGNIGDSRVIFNIINFLKDPDYTVRLEAVIALRKICSPQAISALIQSLQDEDSYVRWNAIYALAKIAGETATSELVNALEDENWDVSFLAAEFLEEVASERVILQLVNRLQDEYYVTKNNGSTFSNAILALELIQQRLKYYKPTPIRTMSNPLSHNYALLIGVGECEEPKLSLPVTVKDIQALKTLLTDQNLCGYIDNDQHLRLLSNSTATSENILDGLSWLKQQAENDPEATIFIYYSGHGCLDESGDYYLIPHETDRVDIPNTALSATKFNAALQQIPAKRLLVIIDSCHAQGMAALKENVGKNNRPTLPKGFTQTALPKNIIDDLKQGTGRVVFTSSTGNQSSWVRPDGKMSVYTYHLLEALQGAANQPGDKVVRISHLMNYLGKTVPETAQQLCKAEQTPFFDFATEDFPVALLRGGKGLPSEGWDEVKTEAQEKIRSISNQVNNGVGIVGDRNLGINIGTAGNITFGDISSG